MPRRPSDTERDPKTTPHVRSGKLEPIAVASGQRLPAY
jgi:hypothetical protein